MTDVPAHARKQAVRLDISIVDLQEAEGFAGELLKIDRRPDDDGWRVIRRALQIAMVIAYSRPFRTSKGSSDYPSTPTVPSGVLKVLTEEERLLHERILGMRDQEYAHSDSAAHAVGSMKVSDSEVAATLQVRRDPITPMEAALVHEIRGIIAKLVKELSRREANVTQDFPENTVY